jgi:hypothetical protein
MPKVSMVPIDLTSEGAKLTSSLVLFAEEEVEVLTKIMQHPAGFNVDLFGGLLTLRGLPGGVYAVSETKDAASPSYDEENTFLSAREAAEFFVKRRLELRLGVDFEMEISR